MIRKIIHIDMDCFYAAIEIRDQPSLATKPIAVGGSPTQRGVLCTSNYLARQWGVRSAMSAAYAKKICPSLIILPVDMPKYRMVAQQIRQIFFDYTPLVEPLSLDEAYLDVSQATQCRNSATLIAQEIRQRIFATCHLTASAGIAPNKFLAKVASDLNKPNGQYVITPNAIATFIKTLPVKKISGVGQVITQKLARLNISTCADLQKKTPDELSQLLGKFGLRLYDLCRGIDHRPVEPEKPTKSLSVEHTFPIDLKTIEECLQYLPQLLTDLKRRLSQQNNRKLHKQFIKIKFHDFKSTTVETISHELSTATFTNLLITGYQRRRVAIRLIGIGVRFNSSIS